MADHTETIRAAVAAFRDRNVEVMIELSDPEIELRPVTALLTRGGEPYRGHDGMRRYFRELERFWETLEIFPEELTEAGPDTFVATGTVKAALPDDDGPFESEASWVWEFRDGKVVSLRVFPSHEQGRTVAGLE